MVKPMSISANHCRNMKCALLGLCLFVTACTSETPGATGGETLTASRAPTPTSSQVPVDQSIQAQSAQVESGAVPTLLPSPSATPALPDVITDDFFFDGFDADCQPPCWHGLRIGQSTVQDVGIVLGQPFVIDLDQDLSQIPGTLAFPGHVSKVQQWFFGDSGGYNTEEQLSIRIIINDGSLKLTALIFDWTYSILDANLRPQRLIRELGVPDQMLVDLRETGSLAWQVLDILVVYRQGIIYFRETIVPVEVSTSYSQGVQQIDEAILEVCLGGKLWEDWEGYGIVPGHLILLEPLRNGLNNLTAAQEWSIDNLPGSLESFLPIQEVFNLSLEQITELAQQPGDACIHKDITEEYSR